MQVNVLIELYEKSIFWAKVENKKITKVINLPMIFGAFLVPARSRTELAFQLFLFFTLYAYGAFLVLLAFSLFGMLSYSAAFLISLVVSASLVAFKFYLNKKLSAYCVFSLKEIETFKKVLRGQEPLENCEGGTL